MKNKRIALVVALWMMALPVGSVVTGRSLTNTLMELRSELYQSYEKREEAKQRFNDDYDRQHQRMIDVIKESNELSILLYTQQQGKTFNMAYALKKVTTDYMAFNQDRKPHTQIIDGLNFEIDRYARLIEALRRLPPEMKEIEVEIVPDSLLYHNDSLDLHMSRNSSTLETEIIRIAVKDTASAPFVLGEEGEQYRDSCILYASELLKMHADYRSTVMTDSMHYQEAYLRLKEAYDYAEARYVDLEKYVFIEGQTPFADILTDFRYYWRKAMLDLCGQYDFTELAKDESDEQGDKASFLGRLSAKGKNALLVIICFVRLVALGLVCLMVFGLMWLIGRYTPYKRYLPRKHPLLFSVLVGTLIYFLFFGYVMPGDDYIQTGVKHINTFLWLLMAFSGSLLLRVNENQIQSGVRLYLPTFIMALVIIICRNIFIPDSMMNFLFPIILLLTVIRQLLVCIREQKKATSVDSTLGWVSLAIYIIALCLSVMGYTFSALLTLVWWYFQLAALLTIVCISDLLNRFKEGWLKRRVDTMRERITYVSGDDRESLLFGVTWYYDLIRHVALPAMFLLSLPMCVHLSLNIFDFNDLFSRFYAQPFISFVGDDGVETMCISVKSLVYLLILFCALRYLNRALHAIWQYVRYAIFMRVHNRKSILANEINLSLGNSIITVLVWFAYAIIIIVAWKIPTGSLGLVAGGLSAGIGLALKDILNNFIYGIQLMGGRLRVGDWIECDGIRGRVTAISYQCVQVETLQGTEMSFLNASLFGKNFNNLTRNNSYEFTKIIVGVAYGTDVQHVREVLVAAMQKMCTKDRYGRNIVDPAKGVYVTVDNMSDSSVDIAVKQFVLVAERAGYIDRAKEVIYNALNAAGISIPFPQCDVHLIKDE